MALPLSAGHCDRSGTYTASAGGGLLVGTAERRSEAFQSRLLLLHGRKHLCGCLRAAAWGPLTPLAADHVIPMNGVYMASGADEEV